MKKMIGHFILAASLLLGAALLAFPASVTTLAGLAVAQTTTKWNSLKDMAFGDGQQTGVAYVSPCLWNGLSCDKQRGSIANGALVDVTRTPGSAGAGFFAVDRANITTGTVNLAFGFTSKKLMVRVSPNNTDNVCVDWIGGAAVCPAANTAGDDVLKPGTTVFMDEYAAASISVIAASGTQEIQVTAWN